MSMLDGVSHCWWLSKACVINWDAWSAIGTVSAVVAALWLARRQRIQSEREQRSKARWVALELRKALANWRRRVEFAYSMDEADLYFLLNDDDARHPLRIPEEVAELRASLHELGDDLAPLVDAIWLARQLSNVPIESALKGDVEDADSAARLVQEFRAGLGSLETHIGEAHRRVSNLAGPVNTKDVLRIFGR